MPWSRLRVNRPTDGALRRHSTIDPTQLRGESENNDAHHANAMIMDSMQIPGPPPVVREPVESVESLVDGASMGGLSSSAVRDRNPRQQRFSMLRFRHASDSQLSKTARDQANVPTPPMPDSEHLPYDELSRVLFNLDLNNNGSS